MNPATEFEILYTSHRADLYAFLFSCTRHEHNAMDLLQDTFLNFMKAFQARTLPGDLECRKYLFRVARNLVINQGKSAYARKVNLTDSIQSTSLRPGPEEATVARLTDEQAHNILGEVLGLLDSDERIAIVLRYRLDFKLDEIAEILDLSISRISRMVDKALRRIKQECLSRGLSLDGTEITLK